MKKILRYMSVALCLCVIGGIAVSAADRKKAEKKPAAAAKNADVTLSGIFEGINTEYDNYVMATYNFAKDKVKIATEKEDIDCTWTLDKGTLLLYYIVDGKPSTEVYETWLWNESKKCFTMKDADGLILKKKGK